MKDIKKDTIKGGIIILEFDCRVDDVFTAYFYGGSMRVQRGGMIEREGSIKMVWDFCQEGLDDADKG